jgi:hypothetical protein
MKKALCVGVYDPALIYTASPYCGDNVFAKGLELNWYDVTRFDYRATPTPDKDLLKIASEIKPDLFWFGKAERISPDTIKILKSWFPKAIFTKWAADVRDEPTTHDIGHNLYMDWFFGTFGGDYLLKHLLPTMKGVASIITFTDSDFYKQIETSDEWRSDVLWTGRKGFGDNNLRNEIIDYLYNESTSKNIKIFGFDKWLGNPEYLYAINGTKIGIGSNSFNRVKYSSDRLGNYMACGTFYLTQYFEGIEEVFERGVNIDWFKNLEEMRDKINYYLENDDLRREVARKGQKFILKHFDCKPLVSNILNIIETGKSNYNWDDVYTN